MLACDSNIDAAQLHIHLPSYSLDRIVHVIGRCGLERVRRRRTWRINDVSTSSRTVPIFVQNQLQLYVCSLSGP
jgi:hypothetical protein